MQCGFTHYVAAIVFRCLKLRRGRRGQVAAEEAKKYKMGDFAEAKLTYNAVHRYYPVGGLLLHYPIVFYYH